MRTRAVIIALLVTAAVAAPASAGEGHEEDATQTARALSLQALALLEQGRGHEEATEKLDEALEAENKGDIDLRALRAAHAALHEEDLEAARAELRHAFPDHHVVGVTFRPAIGTAGLIGGIVGGVTLAVAAFLLARRRRADRRYGMA